MDKTQLKKIVDIIFVGLETALIAKPWFLWPLKMIQGLIDSWIDSGKLVIPFQSAPGQVVDIAGLIDMIFTQVAQLLQGRPFLSMAWEALHLTLLNILPTILPKVTSVMS